MTIRLKNQLNRLYKHKPQSVAPIINTVVHKAEDGDMVVVISAKVVVARIREALSKTTQVSITFQVQILLAQRTWSQRTRRPL